MASDYHEKDYDDEVYEDDYYEEHYDEEELEDDSELVGEEAEAEEDEEEEEEEEPVAVAEVEEEKLEGVEWDDEEDKKVTVSYACDECDYRWDDVVIKKKGALDDDEPDIICPMCGSMNVTLI